MLLHLIPPCVLLLVRRPTPLLLLNRTLKRSGLYGSCKPAELGALFLFLYGRHAILNKAHRSRVAVRPELREVAFTGFIPTRVCRLATHGPNFRCGHADSGLALRDDRFAGRDACRRRCIWFRPFWIALRQSRLFALSIRRHRTYRVNAARKILIEIRSIFRYTLEDLRRCERSEEQQQPENANGSPHARRSSNCLKPEISICNRYGSKLKDIRHDVCDIPQ